MSSYSKRALAAVCVMVTVLVPLPTEPLISVNGFLGKINSAVWSVPRSVRRYRTSLWASVATKVRLSEAN